MGLMSSLLGCRISKHSPNIAPAPHSLTRYSGSQPPLSFANTKTLCLAQGLCHFLVLHQSGFLSYITSFQQLPCPHSYFGDPTPNFCTRSTLSYVICTTCHYLKFLCIFILACFFTCSPLYHQCLISHSLTYPPNKSRKNHNSDKLKLE